MNIVRIIHLKIIFQFNWRNELPFGQTKIPWNSVKKFELTHIMRHKNIRLIMSTAHAGPWNIQSMFVSRIHVHSISN